MANVLFKRGDTATINGTAIADGQLLYNTTTGQQYIDVGTTRIAVGKPVDTALSTTSTNAIANNAITTSIVNTTAEVSAITADYIPCGTKPVKELITSLNGLDFVEISTGKWGYKIGGADPVIPFSSLDFLTNITCTGGSGATATASYVIPVGVTKVLVSLTGTTFEWSTGDFRATDICTVTSSGGTLVETTINSTQNLANNGTSAYVKAHKIEKLFDVKAGDTIAITSYAHATQWAISYANASIYAL